MAVFLLVVALALGLPLLGFGIWVLVKSDSSKSTTLKIGDKEFTSGSVGITAIFLGLLWAAVMIFLGLNQYGAARTEGAQQAIPEAPQAAPATVTVTPSQNAAPTSTSTPPAPTPDSSPLLTPTRAPDTTPSAAPSTSRPKSRGPWRTDLNDVRLIVESCESVRSRQGLFGCRVRVENDSWTELSFVNESSVIFVDDKQRSYGLDSDGTTFDTSQYSYIESKETRRGRLVLDENPSKDVSTLQLRMTFSGSGLNTFTLSVDLPRGD